MPDQIDYELEAIRSALETGKKSAFEDWRVAFERAREEWDTDRARRLLSILKAQNPDETLLASLKYYEASLMVNLGQWKKAQKAYEQSIAICRKLGNQKGELVALNGLANLLRRSAATLDNAASAFQNALRSPLATGANRVILLNGMGLVFYERGDLEQAQSAFAEVLDLATHANDDGLRASALHNLGSIAWTRGKLHDARELLKRAQRIQVAIMDRQGEAGTLASLGLVEEGVGNWDKAIEIYQDALEKFHATGDFYGESQVLVNLGNTYALQNQIEKAISCHEQAYEIAKELGDLLLEGQALTALGDSYRMLGDFQKAEEYLRLAIEIKSSYGEVRSLKHNWQSLGAVYHQQRRPIEAQQAYEKSLQFARNQKDRRMETFLLINLSTLFTGMERFREARTLLSQAKEIALDERYDDCLAWIYEQEGDLELLEPEPEAGKILEAFALALLHACQFNEYELAKLIERLATFWIAHAEDGWGNVSLWFCDSILRLWENMDPGAQCSDVVRRFSDLKAQIFKISHE
jgi:tetratricopeptide (TPR) repeat protein